MIKVLTKELIYAAHSSEFVPSLLSMVLPSSQIDIEGDLIGVLHKKVKKEYFDGSESQASARQI